MFDLEKSIIEWRQQMLVAGIKTPMPLEELEGHLREDIKKQMQSGASVQRAFEVAVQRIGHADELKSEFKQLRRMKFYMTPEEIENCWKDPHNWKWGFYHCKADPRVIVPRHSKWMGWTLNCARPSAIPVLLFVVAAWVVPLVGVRTNGGETHIFFLMGVAYILAVCLLSAYLSSTKRWSR
jgi:Family of unknown function (DUF5808)